MHSELLTIKCTLGCGADANSGRYNQVSNSCSCWSKHLLASAIRNKRVERSNCGVTWGEGAGRSTCRFSACFCRSLNVPFQWFGLLLIPLDVRSNFGNKQWGRWIGADRSPRQLSGALGQLQALARTIISSLGREVGALLEWEGLRGRGVQLEVERDGAFAENMERLGKECRDVMLQNGKRADKQVRGRIWWQKREMKEEKEK